MMIMFRNNRSQMFFKIVVLKNLAIFTGKHLCWFFFLIKCFPVKSAKLLKTCVLKNICVRLLLLRPLFPFYSLPTQVFSSEYCEIFKNSFFIEHHRWLLLNVNNNVQDNDPPVKIVDCLFKSMTSCLSLILMSRRFSLILNC